MVPVGEYANRRPEVELTHALLLIEYHLEHAKHWGKVQRMSCLTDIVIAVQDLREETSLVAARVRDRLRHAKKNESLQIWKGEYLDALSAVVVTDEMQDMLEHKQQFSKLMGTLYSPDASVSSMEEVAARLGPSFHVS